MRRLMQNLTRRWRYKKLFKLFNRFQYKSRYPSAENLRRDFNFFACRETFSEDSSGRFTINLISAHLVKGYKQLAQVFAQAKRLELPEGSLFRHLPTGSDK